MALDWHTWTTIWYLANLMQLKPYTDLPPLGLDHVGANVTEAGESAAGKVEILHAVGVGIIECLSEFDKADAEAFPKV